MNTKALIAMGVPLGEPVRQATSFMADYVLAGGDKTRIRDEIAAVLADPSSFLNDDRRGRFAKALADASKVTRSQAVPYRQWGEGLDAEAVEQMERACHLPVAVAGALMPDAHVGYGLPIGGVLATDNAVIPYAVGVDIACRMKLTVLDMPPKDFPRRIERLRGALEEETRFGIGASFRDRREHAVMDADWSVSPITHRCRDKAWSQLGTSGSGNHFVEFGFFTAHEPIGELPPGGYVALLSHSGSRGTGAQVCGHYSRLAMDRHPDLPKELKHLAWLSLDEEAGAEYWAAMNLMGDYAAANHACIHGQITKRLGLDVLLDLENHHNFAWKESHEVEGVRRDVIVHRKGATPAGSGVLGIIPGSMATPGFVVRGRGDRTSLASASHGAGRLMSRTKANKRFNWNDVNRLLKERGVTLLSAGLDEAPGVYKDIHQVMDAQTDLVDILGRFDPKLVKMAPPGERAED
ncbi:MAG: RtcB family protein [Verrucomicrobiae bacterium]|nr:RtcB family protein [Verrucomicrobiae bacterium]